MNDQKITQLLRKGLSKAFVVSLSTRSGFLQKTPQSIDVSHVYGGLGLEGVPVTNRDKLIYSMKLERKVASKRSLGDKILYTVPSMYAVNYHNLPTLEIDSDVKSKPITWSKVHKLEESGFIANPFMGPIPDTKTIVCDSVNPWLENVVKTVRKTYCKLTNVKDSIFDISSVRSVPFL
jgi:hypothetical protein